MPRAQRRSVKRVTIQAVAARAGVSAMTVSHVVNGTKNVREETRRAVRDAVDQLGYTPSAAARALASAQTTKVGLLYYNAENPFLSSLLVGALNAASRLGAQLAIRRCADLELDAAKAAVEILIDGGANAILLAPPYAELLGRSSAPRDLGVPFVAVAHGAGLPGVATVGVDDAAAAFAMTEMLLAEGHRRIGFIMGPASHSSSLERLEGYRHALTARGVAIDEALIRPGVFSFDSGAQAASELLGMRDRPTAIFASNDDMAAGVSSVAHRLGLRVPEDVSISGYDDSPIAVRIWPTLTTIRQPVDAMAERATELAIACQRNGGLWPGGAVPSERVAYRLVRRESA